MSYGPEGYTRDATALIRRAVGRGRLAEAAKQARRLADTLERVAATTGDIAPPAKRGRK